MGHKKHFLRHAVTDNKTIKTPKRSKKHQTAVILGRVYQASKNYSRRPLRIDLSEKTILGSKLRLKVSYQ